MPQAITLPSFFAYNWKKYTWGNYAYGFPPPTPPVLSAIVSHPAQPDASHATINWTTDVPADSTVHYALNQPPTTLFVTNPAKVTSHAIVLAGMNSGGTYQYTVDSATAQGGRAVSAINSFDQP